MTAGIVLGLAAALVASCGGVIYLCITLTRTYTAVIEKAQERQLQQVAELAQRIQAPSAAVAALLAAPQQEDSQTTPVEIELPVPADLDWPPDPDEFRGEPNAF